MRGKNPMTHPDSRYALFYAPPPESDLHAFGIRWLGRNAYTDRPVEQIVFPGFSGAEIEAATSFPRHYGLHGTLKAPFRLAEGYTRDNLAATALSFAVGQKPFFIPFLELVVIRDFIALMPGTACPKLTRLAEACVREFDGFRAPLSDEEIDRRMAAGLTVRQSEHLKKWGYPYVMDEFRFHITLTGHLKDRSARNRFKIALDSRIKPFAEQRQPVKSLTLFYQKDRKSSFRIIESFPFGLSTRSQKG